MQFGNLDAEALEDTIISFENTPEIHKVFSSLIDALKAKDEYIQNLMRIIEVPLEKTWKLPWALVGIIHSFMWDNEDLDVISSKVTIFWLFSLFL